MTNIKAIGIVVIVFTAMISGCIWPGPDGNGSGSNSGDSSGSSPLPPTPKPDLSISYIKVNPDQPTEHQRFSATVYVKNGGNAPSGQFDIAMKILDISRGYTYPIGTFRQGPMQPGEDYPVWSDNQLLVNDPGAFQLDAEIIPFLFEDGNTQNNEHKWQFNVLPSQ